MKKKIIIPIIIFIIVVAGVSAFSIHSANVRKAQNSSGRRGEIVEDDLAAVVGATKGEMEEGQASYSKGKVDEDAARAEAVVTEQVNEPISDTVEAVSEMKIPEAIMIEEGDKGAFYGNEEFTEVIPVDISSFSKTIDDIPEEYDSRNANGRNCITEIENQGYTYLCWAYAAIGAVEADILKHNPMISNDNLDLSEKHLAYYNAHSAKGSKNGLIDEDYRELVNADNEAGAWIFDYDTNYVSVGGVTDFSISVLTAWKGPVSDTGDDAFNKIFGSDYVFRDNGNAPSDAYNSEYHVMNVNEVCATRENNMMVKQMVMEHGAASIGIYADDRFWSGHSTNLYSHFENGNVPTPNHEVLIIGWDDNYSASNFSSRPAGDGAWICKNSWGKNSGENGYLYLSYYDETSLSSNAAVFCSVVPGHKGWYDNNYQVAGFLTKLESCLEDNLNTVTAYTDAANPYGVLYTASGAEELEAIGFMNLDTYQQYELCIFVNPSVEEGKIVGLDCDEADRRQKISSISGGYHTFELEEPLELSEEDTFFVMIKPVTAGKLIYEKAMDEVSAPNYDEWNNLTGNVHNYYTASGLSYYISNDGKAMEVQTDKDFFVKAYTNNK
jgi:C1A family cysteine protease